MREVAVAIVVSPRDWAERLHRFLADHGGARVRARVLDARDALADGHEVLVAEDLTSFLSPRLVGELHALGRRVLGVYDPAEPPGEERLVALGVDATIRADAAPTDLVRAIVELAGPIARAEREDPDGSDLAGPAPDPPSEADPEGDRVVGDVVAVAGPRGGAGATEVAVHLAGAFARRGERVPLVDADLETPAVAQRLGLDLHPNLRTAVDAVEHRLGTLDSCILRHPSRLAVVGGLPTPTMWAELRPREVVGAVRSLAQRTRRVIVDVGSGIEDLPTAIGPHRYAVARALVADADTLVAVCAATPLGVSRLVRWVAEARRLAPAAPILVAVNRTPSGRFRRAEIEEEICRTIDVPSIGFLPSDPRVERAAWAGDLAPERSGFVRAVDLLHRAVVELTPAREVAA